MNRAVRGNEATRQRDDSQSELQASRMRRQDMLEDYNLHPAIARAKCFRLTPPGNIPREEPPSTDFHWVGELYRWCCEATDTPLEESNPFQRHLDSDTVGVSSPMKEALYILFRRFSTALDTPLGPLTPNEKTTLAGMLMENVNQCIDGFFNRVLLAVSRLAQPKNLDEYLYCVRQRLVDQAAIVGGGMGNESVHTWNRASIIAARQKLGIQANHPNDPHVEAMPGAKLEIALQTTFERWFTPYELPILLQGTLLNEIAKLGYEGKKGEGYATGPISRITNAVGRLLPGLRLEPNEPTSWKEVFAWHPLEGEDKAMEELGLINFHELKLDLILGAIYQSLIGNGYLDPNQLQPRYLPDYAAHWELCQQAKLRDTDLTYHVLAEQIYVQNLCQRKQYGQLAKIFEMYPTYWKHLLEQPDFVSQTGELTQFLRIALRIPQDHDTEEAPWKTEIRHALLVLIALLSTADRHKDETLKELTRLFTAPSTHYHTYLSLVLGYHPDLLSKILEAIDQHKQCWPRKALHAMLFGAWPRKDELYDVDILQQAIDANNPRILKELLHFLKRYSADDAKIEGTLKDLFSKPHRRYFDRNFAPMIIEVEYPRPSYTTHLVEYATCSKYVQARIVQQLLDFATNKPTIFHDSELNKLLSFDYATLAYTLQWTAPGHMKRKIILDCLSSNEIRLSNGAIVSCLFPNTEQPSLLGIRRGWLSSQWHSLLKLVENDTERANTLLLRMSEYKPKLPKPAEKQIIAFVLGQLGLFDLSDSRQKELFERILSNMGDTSLLLRGLLTSSTARNRGTANLPALLHILLPNHLEALGKEASKIPQQQPQLPPSPMRRISQSFASFFRPASDERLKRLTQEIGFIESWIRALKEPNNGDNSSLKAALLELRSNPGGADFLAKNRGWNALFEICCQRIFSMPPPNPSAPTATR